MGGLATAGLVAPILAHTAPEAHTPIVEGILREATERRHALGCAPSWEQATQEAKSETGWDELQAQKHRA